MNNKFRKFVAGAVVLSVFSSSVLFSRPRPAYASFCSPCVFCNAADLAATLAFLKLLEKVFEVIVKGDIEYLLNMEERWVVEGFFKDFWVKGLSELTEYLSAVGMYQVQVMGAMFDAKNQLETSQLFLTLQAEAHRDYHPSDDLCWYGTSSRSMASSEGRSKLNLMALSRYGIERQLGPVGIASALDVDGDETARWGQFVQSYCDPKDNGWIGPGTGLERACDWDGAGSATNIGASKPERMNNDVDYTRLVDIPRTINADFTDATSPLPADEENIIALSSYLFGNQVSSRKINLDDMTGYSAAQGLYTDQRAVVAKRSVAQNSFNTIVAMKTAGTSTGSVGKYIGAIMKDLMPSSTPDDEVYAVIGENPSYYAQLEILGKKIYQNPDFFASLYDNPANVERKSVALKAIELMLDRALFESEIRQEMLLSVMLSSDLNRRYKAINGEMQKGKQ